jgi:hypothetical protein
MMERLAILIFALLTGCGYDDFGGYALRERPAPVSNTTIAAVRALWHGQAAVVEQDMIVRGSVASSDMAGNFYRTLMIQDATGALELHTGLYEMHNTWPEGWRVTLRLKGLRLDVQNGILQIGAVPPPWSGYPVDYLGHRVVVEQYLVNEMIREPVSAPELPAGTLRGDMCGRLVTIPGMVLAGETPSSSTPPAGPVSWAPPIPDPRYPPQSGYRKFKDAAWDSLVVHTSGYASFAAATVPSGTLALTGILGRGPVPGSGGRDVWILRLRNEEDLVVSD